MKKQVFAKSSDIKGRKSGGSEDMSCYHNWRLRAGDNGEDSMN